MSRNVEPRKSHGKIEGISLENPEYSLEGLMLKLNLQYFGHLLWRTHSLEDPDAGKDWRQKEKEEQRMEWLGSITNSVDMNLSKLREITKDGEAWRAAVHGVSKSRTQLSNWKTMWGKKKKTFKIIMFDQKTEGEEIDKFYLKTQSLRKLGHFWQEVWSLWENIAVLDEEDTFTWGESSKVERGRVFTTSTTWEAQLLDLYLRLKLSSAFLLYGNRLVFVL